MAKVELKDITGKKVGDVELDDGIFGTEVNEHLLWETVKWQLAKRRRGTHSTKRRGEVQGTKKKPFKQKGTGRARAGSVRAPHWVGGGSVFGPKPRDYSYAMPKKARAKAICIALSVRAKESNIVVVDDFAVKDGRMTNQVVKALDSVEAGDSVLIVDTKSNTGLMRGTRNLPWAKWLAPEGLNVYDILNHQTLILTKSSVEAITARLGAKQAQPQA